MADLYLAKKKKCEFYILNINPENADCNTVVKIFCDSLTSANVYREEGHTIVLADSYNSFAEQTVNALINDFGIKLKVFRGILPDCSKEDFLQKTKDLYLKHEKNIAQSFISIKDLAYHIRERCPQDKSMIKELLLAYFKDDPKIEEVIYGMFANDLNVSRTAEYVYMHRNTVNNKISFFKEETGFDIRKFQDALTLHALLE